MREIKFKLWDKNLNEMCKDKGYNKDGNWQIFIDINGKIYFWQAGNKVYFDCMAEDKFIFLQYTGLKDRNDKEIYEGDIIKVSPLKDFKSVVEFDNGMFGYEDITNFFMIDTNCEVIGNIYENKELLK